jgi:hypothetical protein
MTWEEIDKDWAGLQKRHRMEIAQAVARYCIGHKMKEVADRLGYSQDWLSTQLDYAGVGIALGSDKVGPLKLTGSTDNVAKELPRVLNEFAPSVDIKLSGGGKKHGGDQTIAAVEGDDAEEFEPYLNNYLEQGHEPAAATRLAKAEWAAEKAVDAGIIKEDVNKRNERVNRILFPTDAKDQWELDFKQHMARVEAASRFLDESKIPFLRRKSTCQRVASVHEKWLEQVERVLNFNPTLIGD